MQTSPYPWPWDHNPRAPLTADRLAVVVCGWQPYWAARVDPSPTADTLAGIRSGVDALREAGAVVMWIRTAAPLGPSRRPPHLPEIGTADAELLAGSRFGDLVIDTPGLDAFLVEWTDLQLRALGRDRLVCCGLGTEGPVSSTNRSANDRGYECLIATDLVVHHDPVVGAASLSSVCMSGGIFGAVGTGAELLDALRSQPSPSTRDPEPT